MNVLAVHKIARSGREDSLFSDVSFTLDEGEKVALIGKNGTGKSTLLACITGRLEPEEGEVIIAKDAGVSFLPQNPVFNPEDTIREHIFKSDTKSLQIIKEYEAVCEALSFADQPALTARLQELSLIMDEHNLWNYENEVKSVLTTLGLGNLDRTMGSLSGGMAKKVSLAQVLIEDTKLLLLDEPTNHLDITTIAWLESWLVQTKKAVLMVTHDRYFLDAVCSSIYEIQRRSLTRYVGNFSVYLEKKALEEEIAIRADVRIESVLRVEREWLRRGPKARAGKSRARTENIHRMINREKFSHDKGFSFEVAGRRLGGKVLEAHSISKTWKTGLTWPLEKNGVESQTKKTRPIIEDFSYIFKKGERIGVFGDNGTGKSTLLRLLVSRLEPDSGSVSVGVNTVFGYYEQNPLFKDTEQTVLAYVQETAENIQLKDGSTLSASLLLERFGFTGKVQHSAITTLSGGERKRVYLVRLLMTNPNFLVLDEPTNDFDIYTLSVLEAFLEQYSGCLLVVSHDRYFMDRVVDTLFILEGDGSVSGFVGSCSEYLDLRKELEEETLLSKNAGATDSKNTAQSAAHNTPQQKKKRSFKEEREYSLIEGEISELEDRIQTLEAFMSSGETDHEKLNKAHAEYEDARSQLDQKIARWEYLASFD